MFLAGYPMNVQQKGEAWKGPYNMSASDEINNEIMPTVEFQDSFAPHKELPGSLTLSMFLISFVYGFETLMMCRLLHIYNKLFSLACLF